MSEHAPISGEGASFDELLSREWLLTNGIGGYASGTVAGPATRRYHALLIAALDPPAGRMTMLSGVDETVTIDGVDYPLATHIYEDGTIQPDGWTRIESFRAQVEWTYRLPGSARLTKSVDMEAGCHAVRITYRCDRDIDLRLAPQVVWKDSHAQMRRWDGFPFYSAGTSSAPFVYWTIQPTPDAPSLVLRAGEGAWEPAGWWNERLLQPIERDRGFDAVEETYCPAVLVVALRANKTLLLRAAIVGEARRSSGPLDTFTGDNGVRGLYRWKKTVETIRPYLAAGDGRITILAGFPWFGDWGRDTFISLPGLCLSTGMAKTARAILASFAPWVKDGRIPNRFPDHPDRDPPAYNNVDGTLWFVRAIGLTLDAEPDDAFASSMIPVVVSILDTHLAGTVGDGVFADDECLLRAGDMSTNLTWMDAKVDGVPITPRFDRPVEVQALWIVALRIGHRLTGDIRYADAARIALLAFVARFVRPDDLGLYDCLLPDNSPDPSLRPNMCLAAALLRDDLPETLLRRVVDTVDAHLLTPYGLRTLSPADPRYSGRYEGGPSQRDSVYHQGTVWPWLIGSYADLRRHLGATDDEIQTVLAPLAAHRDRDFGLNGIAEIFDGDPPHRPNGCPWQAWSMAEFVRALGVGR